MMTRAGKPIKILLTDDDDDDRLLFKEALDEAVENAELKTVNDGKKLMEYLETVNGNQPDIIFLDIHMPGKNGKECLKEIRSKKELEIVPVIMFSTSANKQEIEETFENGANLYVPKPFTFNDEVEILKKIFSLNVIDELLKPDKERFVMHWEMA